MAQAFESLKKSANNITRFEIYPNGGGDPIDVSKGIAELHYYENILSESVKLTVFVTDTGNASKSNDGTGSKIGIDDALKIGNGEKIYVEFSDAWLELGASTTDNRKKNPHKLSFTNDNNAFYLNQKEKLSEHTQKSVYMFDLVSKEYLMNESKRVTKRYDGKISESVKKILKDILETKKELDIDVTNNNFNFIGTAKKPLWTILWLAKKSVPQKQNADGNSAGYLFFETYDGYKFKSIDTLLSDTGEAEQSSGKVKYKSFIFNNSTSSTVPIGYDGKILNYESTNTGNFQNNLMMGTYNSAKNAVNAYDSAFNQNPIDISKQIKGISIAGLDFNFINKIFTEKASRYNWSFDSVGVLPSGKNLDEQLSRSKDLDIDKSKIENRASARYNQLFTINLEILIAGDFSLRAGDLIYCDFPEMTNKENRGNNPRMGGIYMISALCHRISKNQTYTKLELIRDSYGRKPNKIK